MRQNLHPSATRSRLKRLVIAWFSAIGLLALIAYALHDLAIDPHLSWGRIDRPDQEYIYYGGSFERKFTIPGMIKASEDAFMTDVPPSFRMRLCAPVLPGLTGGLLPGLCRKGDVFLYTCRGDCAYVDLAGGGRIGSPDLSAMALSRLAPLIDSWGDPVREFSERHCIYFFEMGPCERNPALVAGGFQDDAYLGPEDQVIQVGFTCNGALSHCNQVEEIIARDAHFLLVSEAERPATILEMKAVAGTEASYELTARSRSGERLSEPLLIEPSSFFRRKRGPRSSPAIDQALSSLRKSLTAADIE